ncbi:hypothetical protein J2W14_004109 [Pseudarthrobacter oxydans]|nr:hypothetical protein [Pseudarthrobacter oxydans]
MTWPLICPCRRVSAPSRNTPGKAQDHCRGDFPGVALMGDVRNAFPEPTDPGVGHGSHVTGILAARYVVGRTGERGTHRTPPTISASASKAAVRDGRRRDAELFGMVAEGTPAGGYRGGGLASRRSESGALDPVAEGWRSDQGIGEKFGANPVTGTGSMTVADCSDPVTFGIRAAALITPGPATDRLASGGACRCRRSSERRSGGCRNTRDADESDVYVASGAEELVPFRQYDAGADAVTCARIAFTIARTRGAPSITGLTGDLATRRKDDFRLPGRCVRRGSRARRWSHLP